MAMSRAKMTDEILEVALESAGGALGGYLDTKYADKTPMGQPLGVSVAAGAILLGVSGIGGKYGKYAIELGGGIAAYEAGKWAAKQKFAQPKAGTPAASQLRVAGVGALPSARRHAVTAQELQASLAALR